MPDDRVRLFTALWPDAAARERIAADAQAWQWPPRARPVAAERLHVTLHFIGGLPRADVDALATALAAVDTAPTTLVATGHEIWRGGIAVLLLAAGPELAALHEAIGRVVAGFGAPLDPRPFAPHVTLARAARGAAPPLRATALDWQARGFALVESAPGGDYGVLRSFPDSGRDVAPGEQRAH
ncbi:MAG: RNA 2',3'-cyclic phosphodiesterase [Rhizobacter sp.]|nr:RNA 2',3'-cyclic phosphodiesterase [Rhizobacter sp.]